MNLAILHPRSVSIVIPTLNAAPMLPDLLAALKRQTIGSEILIIDSASVDDTVQLAKGLNVNIIEIPRHQFNHGGTRNLGVRNTSGSVIVFLTQDALPVSDTFIETLVAPIDGKSTAGAYARQLPRKDANPLEAFARTENYPPNSYIKSSNNITRRTLKSLMFSNTASAIDRMCFESVGGFPDNVASNEDMLLCAKLLDAGYGVAYNAEACVWHSHNYSLGNLWHRYCAIGHALEGNRHILKASTGGFRDGLHFVMAQFKYLIKNGRWDLLPQWLIEAAAKNAAYRVGQFRARRSGREI